ncbi:metallophosphoesterase [Halorussus gelatinilyticus]|uniref:Metallophosphoesterase n=1 Tax=Halorussus gelatinilyticus TaxID=2937524 RepID=A0A8U0IME8_9EURY|nr:metallophosphoesterase [Halorussus gelatinilyticus]UPW02320.1 metallophosphoesterase [Halorussus gelatinilyticus]
MDAQFRDRAVYLPNEDALVVADLHVGRDAASAVELPLGERADLTDRLAGLLAAFSPATVVVAGDLLHAFDRIPEGVAETVVALRETVADAGAELVVVRGNHDSMLDSLRGDESDAALDSESVSTPDEYRVGDALVVHGHAAPDESAARYVVGHDHPAIEIEGTRHPCLLYGPGAYRGGDVLMVPAFNRLAPGATVNGMSARDFQSPLVTDADALRPVVWDSDGDEVLSFPPLGEFRRML